MGVEGAAACLKMGEPAGKRPESTPVVDSDLWLIARKWGPYSSNHKELDCGDHLHGLAYENAAPTDTLMLPREVLSREFCLQKRPVWLQNGGQGAENYAVTCRPR